MFSPLSCPLIFGIPQGLDVIVHCTDIFRDFSPRPAAQSAAAGELAYFDDPAFPENLQSIWTRHWAFVARDLGLCTIVGEWGGPNEGADHEYHLALVQFMLDLSLSSFLWSFPHLVLQLIAPTIIFLTYTLKTPCALPLSSSNALQRMRCSFLKKARVCLVDVINICYF